MTRASGKNNGEIICDHNFVNLVSELTNTYTLTTLHTIWCCFNVSVRNEAFTKLIFLIRECFARNRTYRFHRDCTGVVREVGVRKEDMNTSSRSHVNRHHFVIM